MVGRQTLERSLAGSEIAPRDRPIWLKAISSSCIGARCRLDTVVLTALLNKVWTRLHLVFKYPAENVRFIRDRSPALGQDSQLMPGDAELFDRFAYDLLWH